MRHILDPSNSSYNQASESTAVTVKQNSCKSVSSLSVNIRVGKQTRIKRRGCSSCVQENAPKKQSYPSTSVLFLTSFVSRTFWYHISCENILQCSEQSPASGLMLDLINVQTHWWRIHEELHRNISSSRFQSPDPGCWWEQSLTICALKVCRHVSAELHYSLYQDHLPLSTSAHAACTSVRAGSEGEATQTWAGWSTQTRLSMISAVLDIFLVWYWRLYSGAVLCSSWATYSQRWTLYWERCFHNSWYLWQKAF